MNLPIPEKKRKMEKKKELRDKLIILRGEWYLWKEIGSMLNEDFSILANLVNKWEWFEISLSKATVILEKIDKILNSVK